MFNLLNFTPREYQESIFQSAKEKNTLVVLPTGIGKTAIALLLILERLNKFPDSKVVFCSPTKPLCNQHYETIKNNTNIEKEKITLYTGNLSPKTRKELFESSKVIIATPQTIQSDLENKRIELKNVSLLIIDEAHKTVKNYSYNILASIYKDYSLHPLILALTASPGGNKEKINEIKNNLFIENIEIRTEDDEDVSPYLQEKNVEYIKVTLPQEILEIQANIKKIQNEKLSELRKFGVTKPIHVINKKDLLVLMLQFRREIDKKNPAGFYGVSLVSQLLKLSHALEILETQTIDSFKDFFDKMRLEKTKASQNILNHPEIKTALIKLENLKNRTHPKLEKLIEIIKEQLESNPNAKIMIFANFRNTVAILALELSKINNAKVIKLLGQKEGITQKHQLNAINQFENNEFNVIIATSVGEEGLSINTLDLVIFYESVPSSIRRIQRSGRVARIKPGKIIFIIAEKTRDEAYYWKSLKEEKKMKNILKDMQDDSQSKLI
ncbi:DEAD/DEAH box helicase [Candidatus Woesearchaeota archaeon]|nr:DEAD/DEAH box helicase [Candidatus Woesearchaeota archaeon]